MSINPSPNPLKHVLNAIGEDVEWLTYDTWGVFIPEGSFPSTIGPGPFADTLKKFGAPGAQEQVPYQIEQYHNHVIIPCVQGFACRVDCAHRAIREVSSQCRCIAASRL
jgi:hypothetical protein